VIGGGGAGGSGGVISHEIAHQWFGDAVTEGDWDDAWLSEGFATYFALLYDEHYVGHDQFINGVKGMFQRARAAEEQSKLPLVHENISDLRGVIPQLVYQKGGSVLQMLRGQVGTEGFWTGIREYYRRHKDGNASSDDLRRAFEQTSGQDLQWFFDQWLHWTTTPALEGGWSYDAGAKKIIIDLAQTQPGRPFRVPLEIAIAPEADTSAYVFDTLQAQGARGGQPGQAAGGRAGAGGRGAAGGGGRGRGGQGAQGPAGLRIEKIELTQARQRFEIPADRAPKELTLDPNTWVMMDPPKFVAR
jgi:aminopeptidase N